ncbi:hypothetical protein BHE74_00032854 [Ensete ventricosum]|nr:hypothetical protein GW17_00014532 [Ensete ventricosum]RWW60170.1 hypothetical protein BHE74_00032854 [Ensete ventricosum]
MAQEILDETLELHDDDRTSEPGGERSPSDIVDPSLSRSLSSSRLNARAAEFVPRVAQPPSPAPAQIRHAHDPVAHQVMHVFHQASPSPTYFGPGPSSFDYYGGGPAGGFGEHEGGHSGVDPDQSHPARDGLPEEVTQKITKQVCVYCNRDHLINPFFSYCAVPISVVAGFKKIRALVHNNSQLAIALRTSSKLVGYVVSDDGKKVKRQQPFTESDMEELQVRGSTRSLLSRIVVAENLPEDHCYQNLMKIFSAVGR